MHRKKSRGKKELPEENYGNQTFAKNVCSNGNKTVAENLLEKKIAVQQKFRRTLFKDYRCRESLKKTTEKTCAGNLLLAQIVWKRSVEKQGMCKKPAALKIFWKRNVEKQSMGKKILEGNICEENIRTEWCGEQVFGENTCKQTSGEDIAAENICKETTHADKFPEKKSLKKH